MLPVLRRIGLGLVAAWLLGAVSGCGFGLGMRAASAQDHQHQHGTEVIEGATGKFYETWKKPDDRSASCCNKADCYATEAHFNGRHWKAKRREDGKWLTIPDEKVEQERDSPDGLSHLCAPSPYSYDDMGGRIEMGDTVYCFKFGGGT